MKTDQKHELSIHLFHDHTIRTTEHEGMILFCAADVCNALAIINNRDALSSLKEKEKITVANADGNPRAGLAHQMTYVTEPGLYRLIFKSRKAEAAVFQDWVFHEVLPSIRRKGVYGGTQPAYLQMIDDQISRGISPDLAARNAIKLCPGAIPIANARRDAFDAPFLSEMEEILTLFHADTPMSIRDIVAQLPPRHRLSKGTPASRSAAVGKLLIRAVRMGRLEKNHGRTVTYQLPRVVSIVRAAD
jgi:prophage antirepressor-like protein